jgi:hypothetical protein
VLISNICHLKHIYIIPYPNTPASNYPMDFFHFHSYEDLKPLLPLHWQETTNNVRRNKATQQTKRQGHPTMIQVWYQSKFNNIASSQKEGPQLDDSNNWNWCIQVKFWLSNSSNSSTCQAKVIPLKLYLEGTGICSHSEQLTFFTCILKMFFRPLQGENVFKYLFFFFL